MGADGAEEGRARAFVDAMAAQGDLLILPHDHPDPDGLASAFGVQVLLQEWLGQRAPIALSGMIGRSENRAMVAALGIELVPFEVLLREFKGRVILVDTQPGRGNNSLPPSVPAAAVIDHHPDWGNCAGVPYVDLRPEYGATSTIMTEYLRELGMRPSVLLATALFYGISSETRHLARDTRAADVRCSRYLYRYVDPRTLGAIESPALERSYFSWMSRAAENALLVGDVALTLLESVPYPDAVAEVADLMIRVEGVRWAACLAHRDGSLYVSLRATDPAARAGLLLASLLPPGAAGGHGMTAGGRVSLEDDTWPDGACDLAKRLLVELGASDALPEWLVVDGERTRDPLARRLRAHLDADPQRGGTSS
jgi:nanoRNase/pAp phosphatase (c-di-AMP/oligoRNAs hydrolase)